MTSVLLTSARGGRSHGHQPGVYGPLQDKQMLTETNMSLVKKTDNRRTVNVWRWTLCWTILWSKPWGSAPLTSLYFSLFWHLSNYIIFNYILFIIIEQSTNWIVSLRKQSMFHCTGNYILSMFKYKRLSWTVSMETLGSIHRQQNIFGRVESVHWLMIEAHHQAEI